MNDFQHNELDQIRRGKARTEELRSITCACGTWEEMPVDQQRHHSQTFEWIENTVDEALYTCPDCCRKVKSSTRDKFVDHGLEM